MANAYLPKIAADLTKPKATLVAKLGLGASLASLGISAVNYASNRQARDFNRKQIEVEKQQTEYLRQQAESDRRALNALKSIHKTIKAPTA
jgi:hypothetical protein